MMGYTIYRMRRSYSNQWFSGLISSGLTLQALDELGVDAIPAQDANTHFISGHDIL